MPTTIISDGTDAFTMVFWKLINIRQEWGYIKRQLGRCSADDPTHVTSAPPEPCRYFTTAASLVASTSRPRNSYECFVLEKTLPIVLQVSYYKNILPQQSPIQNHIKDSSNNGQHPHPHSQPQAQ